MGKGGVSQLGYGWGSVPALISPEPKYSQPINQYQPTNQQEQEQGLKRQRKQRRQQQKQQQEEGGK
jgi:hypothetical protein